MTPSISVKHLAALSPFALVAALLAGCPDTSVSSTGSGSSSTAGTSAASSGGGPAGPVGRVKLVQTLGKADDPEVNGPGYFVVSPNGKKVYATSWSGSQVVSFDRSPLDGSLARAYTSPVYNAAGIAITPDGNHLYATGANNPNQTVQFDIDPVTGEPTPKANIVDPIGGHIAVAAGGTLLFLSQGALPSPNIQAYRINPTSGALTAGAKTAIDSPQTQFVFLADDEHGTLYAERNTGYSGEGKPVYIVRYAVDPGSGALTKQAETVADISSSFVHLARCEGTTRLYVAQGAGNIGYADIGGTGLSISRTFSHPDLTNVVNASLSPDCKNLYAVTQANFSGSLVVLARDDAGDLTWLQTIKMGPNTAIPDTTNPLYALTSPDGKNVYVSSDASGEGFVVFQRDTTGRGFP
jgi:6-phosphogluconolactonase (cycloisomerase 2 family)